MLCVKKYARLRARFFRNCLVAIGANIALIFFLGVAFDGVISGAVFVGAFLLLASLELLLMYLTHPRLSSPPYFEFSDPKYPFLVSAWRERLTRDGYEWGKTITYADVTLHDRVLKCANASVFPPCLFSPAPMLVVSESLVEGAKDAHVVAILEHELAHLRSRTHVMRTIAIVLARPFRSLLLCVSLVRTVFEIWNVMYLASPLYGFELYIQRVSSQFFEHDFELIADALAVEAMGDMHKYIEALTWLESFQEVDHLSIFHNEHVYTHPTLPSRIATLCHLCA